MAGARMLRLLLVPLLAGCEAPETEVGEPGLEAVVDEEAVEAEIGRMRDAWRSAALSGDAATVAALYADDARMVGPTGELAEGRQAIQSALLLEGLTTLEINSTDREVGTDVASDMGTFTQTLRTPQGQTQTVNGRYLVVVRRQPDGNWRIVQHLVAAAPEGQMMTGM